jgi:chromosome segregation protein
MKLKKLEIIGFKSFHDKAVINFPPGISAVVGPNGCGKSNIVDALRWVMGEQSVKQLRGKSMEDIIFAGTNGKPPLNMAEVSLTLSSENSPVPRELKDFSEIMITRRLYRSGERRYYINKQPCRLKDIMGIFLGSGMGAKSYAVIQQGNIGAITDAGPQERRFFIEEAAGITRYKVRKNEALSKVKSTNQNLLRVNDIITEITRQMSGLKRQARKAGLFKKTQTHIMHLDTQLAIRYYDNITEKIKSSEKLLNEYTDTDLSHVSQLKKIDAAIEQIKFEKTKKSQEISQEKTRQFELQRGVDRMENDLGHLQTEIKRLTEEVVELKKLQVELEDKNIAMTSETQQVENKNSALTAEVEAASTTLSKERAASQGIRDSLSSLNKKIEDAKNRLMELVAQEARYKNIYQTATLNRESLKRRLKRIDEEEVLANRTITVNQKKEAGIIQKRHSLEKESSDLNQKITGVQTRLSEKKTALGSRVKETQALDFDRNKTRSKYAALKKMEERFDWYKDGVKTIMRRFSTQKEGGTHAEAGIIGLMADILEPEPSFEMAVEAVLDESLQYVLVKNQSDASEAIHFLQDQKAGRSGFIPISSLKPMEIPGFEKIDPQLRLLNRVTIKPGFEEIAQALLGHVVVVADLEEALQFYNEMDGCRTIVTKTGDLVSYQGIMIGGSSDKLSGILAKKQELKLLEQHIAQQDEALTASLNQQKELESQVRTMESELQKLMVLKSETGQAELQAEKELYKATEDTKQSRRQLEIIHLEQERLLGEESDVDAEMTRYNTAVAKIVDDVKAAQKEVSDKSTSINTISTRLQDVDRKNVDLELNLTTLKASLENGINTLRRLKEFHNDSQRRLENLCQEIVGKETKQTVSKQQVAENQRTLLSRYDTLKALEKVIDSNDAEYQAIDEELKKNDIIVSKIQTQRESALQKIRMLEIEQSQQQMKRENIETRLVESYHKTIADIKSETGQEEREEIARITTQEMETDLEHSRNKIAKLADVNLGAIKEYEQLKDRFLFLEGQRDDLVKAIEDLHKVIRKINRITQERFLSTFNKVNQKIGEVFPRLFEGGSARLLLTDPNDPLETGVEFMIHPPGKKLTHMSLLSGGEKALSAIAFIFAIFLLKPASFCLLDEIDAPLDDANIFRFNDLLQIIGENSQIVLITHNKRSMEFADTLFGITMEKKGISKIVSVNLERTQEESQIQSP